MPIFEYGIPVEYELVRSINTVARGSRKRLGIVATDARLMGGTVMSGMSMQRVEKHPLIDELAKQYDVEEVDLSGPITPGVYDALVAVQPSSLAPQQFDRLTAAIQAGVPTAIFEDPRPIGAQYVTATGDAKQAQGGMFGGGGASPKGDIRQLWDVLELNVPGQPGMQGLFSPELVWQQHNPYPNLETANELWLFIDEQARGVQPGEALSDDSPITSGLRQVLAILGGAVYAKKDATLKHTALLSTGPLSGTLPSQVVGQVMTGQTTLAQEIQGVNPSVPIAMAIEADESAEGSESETAGVKAVYIADMDIILPEFLLIRADPDQISDMRFQFQNVTFALNVIDWLTGDTSFIDVRNHEPIYASLRMIDSVKEEAASLVRKRSREFQTQYDETIREAQEKSDQEVQALREEIEELQKDRETGSVSPGELREKLTAFQIKQANQQRILEVQQAKLQNEREQKIQDVRREAEQEVTAIQNQVKTAAVVLPCIPPLIVGIMVFASRRLRERENISKSRLK